MSNAIKAFKRSSGGNIVSEYKKAKSEALKKKMVGRGEENDIGTYKIVNK